MSSVRFTLAKDNQRPKGGFDCGKMIHLKFKSQQTV